MERKIIPGGLYRHYKNKWYFILGEATHTETREAFVTYFPLYEDTPMVFVRPKDMFLEAVDPQAGAGLQSYRFLEADAVAMDLAEKRVLLAKAQQLLNGLGLAIMEE